MTRRRDTDPAYRKLRQSDAAIMTILVNRGRKTETALERARFALELAANASYKNDLLDLTFQKLWPPRATIVADAIREIDLLSGEEK